LSSRKEVWKWNGEVNIHRTRTLAPLLAVAPALIHFMSPLRA
jgi:hypothetical protein